MVSTWTGGYSMRVFPLFANVLFEGNCLNSHWLSFVDLNDRVYPDDVHGVQVDDGRLAFRRIAGIDDPGAVLDLAALLSGRI